MRVEKSLVGSTPNEIPVREDMRFGYKRVGHGGVAWTASAKAEALHQPQDGAQENGTLYTAMSRMALREPEDARLTGGTRSLMRRVMGLNVTALAEVRKAQPRPVVVKSQAQVA
jgi:hypothetical protein